MISKSIFIAYAALVSLISISKCDPLTEPNTTGFTIDLIHIDSPQSPSYDPTSSRSQCLLNALQRSFNRAERFKTNRSRPSPESDIINSKGEYLMKYFIGTPPVPSLGIADTGSDIIWTQCQPCLNCFNQKLPIFKPNTSTTYRKIHCNTTKCNSLQETFCSKTGKKCLYSEAYADKSFTQGELATDTITLPASTGGKRVSVPNIIFGCGFNNGGLFSGGESGIVGLGGGKASLVRQLGHGKFSYCLVSISDKLSSSKLNFGANAHISGKGVVSTPLVRRNWDTYYYLTLKGISVGDQRLEFYDTLSAEVKARGEGNMIIDSGTTLTLFPFNLYNKLEKAMKKAIKLKQIKDPLGVLDLCYFSRKDIKIPDVSVHFEGGDVKWKHENVLVRTSNISLCLAAKPVVDLAIYGNLAQVNFLVGYDLDKRTVSFKPTDCGKL